MQGGALALARRRPSAGEPAPQVIFASSMLDLPLYRVLRGPQEARVPAIVYFHENQLTYPLPEGVTRDLSYGWKNLTTALAADKVLFNSAYHRAEFLEAAAALLERLPDEVPQGLVEEVAARSRVLALGCDLRRFDAYRSSPGAARSPESVPLVLWNQRWEYDKAPDEVAAALLALADEGYDFEVALAGPSHGAPPKGFTELRRRLGKRVVQWGEVVGFGDYARLLWQADIVVSAARHEFFGQAIVEAIYCGCRPVLPRRLSYPELIPKEAHDLALYDEGDLVPALRRALSEGRPWSLDWQRTWVSRFDWGSMVAHYDEEIWRAFEQADPFGLERRVDS